MSCGCDHKELNIVFFPLPEKPLYKWERLEIYKQTLPLGKEPKDENTITIHINICRSILHNEINPMDSDNNRSI